MKPQGSHSKSGYISEIFEVFCVEWSALQLCLRRMGSITPLSAHIEFSSVHPGFGLSNEPQDCMKIIEGYLKRSELSASNATSTWTLFWITERKKMTVGLSRLGYLLCMYKSYPSSITIKYPYVPLSYQFSRDYIKIV